MTIQRVLLGANNNSAKYKINWLFIKMLSLPSIAPQEYFLCEPALGGRNQNIRPQTIDDHDPQRVAKPIRSHLAQLRTDEHIIELRKFNVKRFGAGWLRPPGVIKTLQSKLEEAQEQLEQVEIQRRDAELRAQEEAAQHVTTGSQAPDGETLPDQEERDLDADVPEAEQSALTSDEDPEYTASVTFNETSLLHGSPVADGEAVLEIADAELDGRLQDERDLGMTGDLDDDVPEAGSYEHTDTEEEDSSGEDEAGANIGYSITSARSDGRARRSLISEDSAMLDNTSFVHSSPAIARHTFRGNDALRRSPGTG